MSRVILEQTLKTVPFVEALGISVEDARPGQVVLRLPAAARNKGHGGTMHTAALAAVGELAAGVALGTHPRLLELVHLLRATRIAYLAPATGDVTAHARVTQELVDAAIEGVGTEGRAKVEIPVQLLDGYGQDVAEVISVFRFKPRR